MIRSFCCGQILVNGLPQICTPICRSGVIAPVGRLRSGKSSFVSGVSCSRPKGAFHCPILILASGIACQLTKMSVPENSVRLEFVTVVVLPVFTSTLLIAVMAESLCSKSPSTLTSNCSAKSPVRLMRARLRRNRSLRALSPKRPSKAETSPPSKFAWMKPPRVSLNSGPAGVT